MLFFRKLLKTDRAQSQRVVTANLCWRGVSGDNIGAGYVAPSILPCLLLKVTVHFRHTTIKSTAVVN